MNDGSSQPQNTDSSASVGITVNGEPRAVTPGTTLHDLLDDLKLRPDVVAIEVNRRLVRASGYGRTLEPGDAVEVVTFVGGG